MPQMLTRPQQCGASAATLSIQVASTASWVIRSRCRGWITHASSLIHSFLWDQESKYYYFICFLLTNFRYIIHVIEVDQELDLNDSKVDIKVKAIPTARLASGGVTADIATATYIDKFLDKLGNDVYRCVVIQHSFFFSLTNSPSAIWAYACTDVDACADLGQWARDLGRTLGLTGDDLESTISPPTDPEDKRGKKRKLSSSPASKGSMPLKEGAAQTSSSNLQLGECFVILFLISNFFILQIGASTAQRSVRTRVLPLSLPHRQGQLHGRP